MSEQSLFDDLGGESGLRPVIDTFIDRVFDDVMIGFLFRNASRERVKRMEYEFAARHLGAPIVYTGMTIAAAHAKHPIMGGHFMRRLQILKDTMREFGVPEHVQAHWIEHTLQLRPIVTNDALGECNPEAARARVRDNAAAPSDAPADPAASGAAASGAAASDTAPSDEGGAPP